MAAKPSHAKIVLASELCDELIDESIRVGPARIKELDALHNKGTVILEDNKTLLIINTSLLQRNQQLNNHGIYYFIGEYRIDKQLYLRIAKELPNNFDFDRYLKCLSMLRR